MGDISKNFDRKEFACKCGCGLDNISQALIDTVQAIRDAAATPVIVNCGCRCKKHNAEVGGVANSSHMEGLAADIYISGWTDNRLGDFIKKLHSAGKLPFLRYCYKIGGKTNTALHVDVDGGKRRSKVFGF